MTKKANETQYNWALARVEQLLPLVTDETLITAPESIELQLLSNLVADYSDEHFSIGDLPEEPSARILHSPRHHPLYANA